MLIGVTGTLASGKDTLSSYLTKNKDFFHFSLSDAIREECDKRGLPKDRDTLVNLGNDLRAAFGSDILARRAVEAVQRNKAKNAVLTSIRNPIEAEFLKKLPSFVLISVNAPIKVRYERIVSRKRASDFVDFKTFRAQEEKEMSGTAREQDLKKVMTMADYNLINDGTLEEFHKNIETVLGKINASQDQKNR
ncbi:MAG: AAA family ATPase [Candidatus Doudnabacteria bacterium]|nr:AAA family ATPase [Candidatus Doudnabacteria bacterium]